MDCSVFFHLMHGTLAIIPFWKGKVAKMICHLNGTLLQKYPDFIILDVNGVGYKVIVPASTLCALPRQGTQAQLYISTYIREDAFRLYGFITLFDKQIFESLLDVSGVGPKVAIALLGAMNGAELCNLIIGNQINQLTNIPGIGGKTAERLVLELKTKSQKLLARFREQQLFSTDAVSMQTEYQNQTNLSLHTSALLDDLNSALANMGYKEKQYNTILQTLQKRLNMGETLVFEEILRDSLKKLSEKVLKN